VTAAIYTFPRRRRPDGIVGLFHLMSRAAQQRRIAEMLSAGIPMQLVATVTRRSTEAVCAALKDEQ
jgi:hypothetical protein